MRASECVTRGAEEKGTRCKPRDRQEIWQREGKTTEMHGREGGSVGAGFTSSELLGLALSCTNFVTLGRSL